MGYAVDLQKLEPSKHVKDLFTIEEVDGEHPYTQLRLTKTGETFQHYTLIANVDLTYSARICQPIKNNMIF